MTTEITNCNALQITAPWYDSLIEDLNNIIDGVVESRFNYSWELIDCYHQIGTRLIQENDNFEREKIYGKEILQRVAKSIGRSYSTVRYAVKFAKMFPDLNLLPEGKNIHWKHIINKYLTAGEEKPVKISPTEMIKRIKQLLQHEWEESYQYLHEVTPLVNAGIAPMAVIIQEKRCEFIRYLQDQVEKITNG